MLKIFSKLDLPPGRLSMIMSLMRIGRSLGEKQENIAQFSSPGVMMMPKPSSHCIHAAAMPMRAMDELDFGLPKHPCSMAYAYVCFRQSPQKANFASLQTCTHSAWAADKVCPESHQFSCSTAFSLGYRWSKVPSKLSHAPCISSSGLPAPCGCRAAVE